MEQWWWFCAIVIIMTPGGLALLPSAVDSARGWPLASYPV